ncbi:kielin/chordin-like protein [Dendronephthya gigantea]|uniref:kielin/chordin-like protein n=1 Tax=Dendronephthya gigantea TaxID=151771 RepID=UPI00106D6292|nr:kielin/chordin-like protein [Dendronephthya gigantea]
MGKCEYVLAKDSVNNTFEIRQVNEECGNGEPSCTKSLTVMFPNVTIQLLRGSVTANGMTISLSTMYMANGVKISQPRSGITLVESDYGVEVEWNNVHNVRVTVFGRYLNRTSGLCGTYNRYRGDDS